MNCENLSENNNFIRIQAYAELEKDTPGQIFGVTFKADGKSTDEQDPISEKFTQRAKNEDFSYEEHDKTQTRDYRANIAGNRFLFWIAFFLFLSFLLAFANKDASDEFNDTLREQTLARQRAEKDKSEGFRDA